MPGTDDGSDQPPPAVTSTRVPEMPPATVSTAAAQPDPNRYQPPDWIPGAKFLHNVTNVFDNSLTGGLADYGTAQAGRLANYLGIPNSTPDIATLRANTEQSRQDAGPVASAAADAAGFVMGPGKAFGVLGKTAPVIGRYGAAALEGGAANATNSVGNQLGGDIDWSKVGKESLTGAGAGVGGQVVGDLTAPLARSAADAVSGLPGRAGGDPGLEALRKQALENPGSTTGPGWMANTTKAAANIAAGVGGFMHGGIWNALGGSQVADRINRGIIDPIARAANGVDRNVAINQKFDDIYNNMGSPITTNDAPWRQVIRQMTIGGSQGF